MRVNYTMRYISFKTVIQTQIAKKIHKLTTTSSCVLASMHLDSNEINLHINQENVQIMRHKLIQGEHNTRRTIYVVWRGFIMCKALQTRFR